MNISGFGKGIQLTEYSTGDKSNVMASSLNQKLLNPGKKVDEDAIKMQQKIEKRQERLGHLKEVEGMAPSEKLKTFHELQEEIRNIRGNYNANQQFDYVAGMIEDAKKFAEAIENNFPTQTIEDDISEEKLRGLKDLYMDTKPEEAKMKEDNPPVITDQITEISNQEKTVVPENDKDEYIKLRKQQRAESEKKSEEEEEEEESRVGHLRRQQIEDERNRLFDRLF